MNIAEPYLSHNRGINNETNNRNAKENDNGRINRYDGEAARAYPRTRR